VWLCVDLLAARAVDTSTISGLQVCLLDDEIALQTSKHLTRDTIFRVTNFKDTMELVTKVED